jgi:hypothetical protein
MFTKKERPHFYIRMQKDGIWYFLLRVAHDKHQHCMRPVWWPEYMRGMSRPYLYKTLTMARNAQDSYVSPLATQSSVEVWHDGRIQN